MNRKIFAILSLAVLAIVCVGTVSAADSLFGFGGENETVTIDDVDFNIPKGFEEDKSNEIVDLQTSIAGVDYIQNGKMYEKGSDIFVVMVASYDGYNVTSDIIESIGGDKETVNGVDGCVNKDDDFSVFYYPQDGKLAIISTNNQDLFDEIVINNK